jgi:hypothetical protein
LHRLVETTTTDPEGLEDAMRLLSVGAVLLWSQLGAMPATAWAQSAADEAAIKSVVLAETDRFFARDFEGWAATFVHAAESTQVWNNADGSYTYRQDWETISARIREFMAGNPEPDRTPMARENFQIRFYGDAAFVTFDKYLGDRATATPIREIRVVERQGGEWKIVCVAAFIDHVE